jgi:hypothetical protein
LVPVGVRPAVCTGCTRDHADIRARLLAPPCRSLQKEGRSRPTQR